MRRYLEFFSAVMLFLFALPLFAQNVPEIGYDSAPNLLKLPADIFLGEAAGVAQNSKGHMFVFTRSGETQLFEFDQEGNYVREISPRNYSFAFAHTVRVDPQDNVWAVDEGTNMIVKFSPEGKVLMTLGRKPEDFAGIPGPVAEEQSAGGMSGGAALQQIFLAARPGGAAGGTGGPGGGGGGGEGAGAGPFVTFNRETDVAWDPAGNSFVSDGYGNKRVVKFDKDGNFVKAFGSRGHGPGQFEDVHTIQVDHQGNVYVGDRSNKRIQVFDNDGTFKTTYINVGAPWAICITPGQHQYLYSSNSTGTTDMSDNGEIYKMELDGKILGKFGRGGKQLKEFMAVHEIDCRNENEIYVGEISNWRVQKLTLHPAK
jgi:hypothetical protein